MERREFLIGATGTVAAMALAKASAAETHTHGGHAGHGMAKGDPKSQALRDSTLACQEAAADCSRHCIELLAGGDESLASCLQSVLRMQAITRATFEVVASESVPTPRSRQLAAVCADFCRDCAEECKPHADDHAVCKACLEACQHCIEACEAYAA